MTEQLIDAYDAVGFDLDGVVYRGPYAVPGAAAVVAELRRQEVKVGFVTNNAQRPPQTVADHLERLGIACRLEDVVTSAQATARLMADQLPAGAEVLIVGSAALADEVAQVGLSPVSERSPATAAIVIGYDPEQRWADFNEAAYAVQAGARYFACNDDQTRPTEFGIAVGMGGMLAAMTRALPGLEPTMGGKPARALLDETALRFDAQRMIFVGDRLDTDIEGAVRADLDSLFVFSGSHGKSDLAQAGPNWRPTWIGADLAALLAPPRRAESDQDQSRCGQSQARLRQGRLSLDQIPSQLEGQLDALWAILQLVWAERDAGRPLEVAAVLASLDLVP
ncbi:MAG: HAD-IIA family hydrolase [Propionibacteriaceae bacterium]|jgi:HAD superfamily hydrolase (TIGR01450 family)|nr:HAD-IIA family hydrolase [Propionibacteriaceae bacterium]